MSHAKRIRKTKMRIRQMKRGQWLTMRHMLITMRTLKKHHKYIDYIGYEYLIRHNTRRDWNKPYILPYVKQEREKI